jgi:predicted Zn finger-like uncharacterized protein
MLVQCPKCKTTYKVSDDAIKGAAPAFRCSRCKHMFELEPAPTSPPAGGTSADTENAGSTQPDERELTFTFGPGDPEQGQSESDKAPRPSEQQLSEPPSEPEPLAHDETAETASTRIAGKTDDQSFAAPAPQSLNEEITPQSDAAPPARDPVAADPPSRAMENIVPINEFRDQAASTVPYLTLFGLLVILFFITTAYLEAHPNISESVLRKIPLIGASVLRNSYLKNGVLLKSQRAVYQSIEGNREVLVVTGEAVNQNPVVVREIRVLGRLYNTEGKAVEQQVIWLGNALSPKILRGMSPQDIADLQRLKPLKNFDVPPGDSIPFAIVFLRPSKAIKDFSCEVVSAEGAV